MIDYIDQSYKELVLTLSKEQIHEVNVLKSVTFKVGDFLVDLSIIGASHSININNQLLEMFAATKVQSDSLLSQKINEISNVSLSYKNFRYSFKLVDSLNDYDYDLEFNYIFPGENKPETKILLKRIKKLIIINTLHFYPNERTTILTETIIEVL